MTYDLKNIHLGNLMLAQDYGVDMKDMCILLECSNEQLNKRLLKNSIDSELLLKISILLEYDFFRVYSQHLLLYSPPSAVGRKKEVKSASSNFKKNLYTREIIAFIIELVDSGEKNKQQTMEDYRNQHCING